MFGRSYVVFNQEISIHRFYHFIIDRVFIMSPNFLVVSCVRPHHPENTGSRSITEVKQGRAALVLGWVTAWEYAVPYAFCPFK